MLFPKDAPWLADYLKELAAFPGGKHDDQVDSTTQALEYLTARKISIYDLL
jgi:predicted phage terminase large subunit-like protein